MTQELLPKEYKYDPRYILLSRLELQRVQMDNRILEGTPLKAAEVTVPVEFHNLYELTKWAIRGLKHDIEVNHD